MAGQNQETFKISHLAGAFSILGVIYLVCILLWQKTNAIHYILNSFHMNKPLTYTGISIGSGIIMAIVAIVLVKVTGTKIPEEDNEQLKELMMSPHSALLIGLLPGFFEEMFFRGFILPFIIQFTTPAWGVIITTIIFWLLHFPQYKTEIVLNLNVIMLSVVTSILFILTASLWAPIFAHIVYNYLVTLSIQKKYIHI